ncbi:MAG: HD domain-containing protein [Candidatus Woesearchaeota archaeon]
MELKEKIEKTKEFVKEELGEETTGHDYYHSLQVYKNAKLILKDQEADEEIVLLACLLHDIGDWKLHGAKTAKQKEVKEFLENIDVTKEKIEEIRHIIEHLAYKGPKEKQVKLSIEGQVVQDADRLEALGATGIARAFATGQKFGQPIHDPKINPSREYTKEEYEKQYTGERKNTTINHFYEKLLLIKDQINTPSAKEIALKRHEFMEHFLKQFFEEWEGKK